MERTLKLTDPEYKVVLAVRNAMTDVENQRTSSSPDLRAELEGVYDMLNNMTSYNQNEVINEVRSRIYAMLY